jgi:uncharacterized protein DUF742
MDADDKWIIPGQGPVVRPYTVTGGRTEPADGEVLDLMAQIVASRGRAAPAPLSVGPEHRRIIRLCRRPTPVADVAAETGLPLGVVRVLISDLVELQHVSVIPVRPADEQPSADVLKEVLRGLRAL